MTRSEQPPDDAGADVHDDCVVRLTDGFVSIIGCSASEAGGTLSNADGRLDACEAEISLTRVAVEIFTGLDPVTQLPGLVGTFG